MSIAYASNFGGIATIIGTPPNVAFISFIEKKYGFTYPFLDWMLLCMPIALLLMWTLYIVLTKVLYRNGMKSHPETDAFIQEQVRALGPLSPNERKVLYVFVGTAFLWIFRDVINNLQTVIKLDDTLIAMAGGLSLFIIPSSKEKEQLLIWKDTEKMAWGILLLFGGGISLANQLEKAGLIEIAGKWMASSAGDNLFLLVFLIAVASIFISEIMSNVAQVIVFAPVIAGMADVMQINPLLLGVPLTLGASCASMLPMGTPPNAIVFASGRLRLSDMLKTGLVMNLIAIVLITLFSYYLLPVITSSWPST
jgi:sodium-dependent dicarboxylate transporter 2/3/5